MHGEYKIPGGKLVVVDVDVDEPGGVLRNTRVAGDFFLEPDEALDAVNHALDGAPVDTDAAGLTTRIEASLPEGTVMYGLTAEGIAIAVRRALAHATDWTDYAWQLIHEGPQAPALHMALDEVLTAEVAAGRRPPTLRVWEWADPAVIIGSFQSLRNEVDPEGAQRHGIDVVRRISGAERCSWSRATRSPTRSRYPRRSFRDCPSRTATPISTTGSSVRSPTWASPPGISRSTTSPPTRERSREPHRNGS